MNWKRIIDLEYDVKGLKVSTKNELKAAMPAVRGRVGSRVSTKNELKVFCLPVIRTCSWDTYQQRMNWKLITLTQLSIKLFLKVSTKNELKVVGNRPHLPGPVVGYQQRMNWKITILYRYLSSVNVCINKEWIESNNLLAVDLLILRYQ